MPKKKRIFDPQEKRDNNGSSLDQRRIHQDQEIIENHVVHMYTTCTGTSITHYKLLLLSKNTAYWEQAKLSTKSKPQSPPGLNTTVISVR